MKTHPRTKKKIVNVNPAFLSHIIGLPPQESEGVLSFLFTLPTRSEFQYSHKWSEGTLAVWGNSATQNAVVDDFFPAYREFTRVTFGGHGQPY